jgi:hypothetical protein
VGRYGRAAAPEADEADPLMDRVMPAYDIVERHHIRVAAPPAVTFATACDLELNRSPLVRAIFRARERILGSAPDTARRPTAFLALVKSIGWGVLAEEPGRELVLGAVTQPWLANVVFHPLPPASFEKFDEPGYVKIAWTLRVDPAGDAGSMFRTETRALATDPAARVKFRRYWSLVSPGVVLIRRLLLGPVRAEAERRARPLRYFSTDSRMCRVSGRRTR